ncbi:hypothetical protein BD779DRAFT_1501670 [Infundibulicybe gibba]|nr:hypothetical protein BD779DRAFT_1501670 [Infundibulicybe gibba]
MKSLLFSASLITLASSRLLHSLPEDTYAFPKFAVAFLNGLPLLNETAQRWLREGLHGGELEFLDQPWKEPDWQPNTHLKEIGNGDTHQTTPSHSPPATNANYTLEHMKMGPRDSYLCLIPKPLDNQPSPPEEQQPDEDVTPARSWSLLQPLSGTCLYVGVIVFPHLLYLFPPLPVRELTRPRSKHRQGWFTYSYCHNEEIRQFKELIQAQPLAPGGYKPEEDPEWESYTLGKAPPTPEPGADLTVAEKTARAANLELARSAGSRYLVQRWGDGTVCDKTGKSREVEVQFHCSMSMTDTILFVKEAKTCSYVLVVQTPRLCSEPGFRSRRDVGEEAQIRCREIVDTPTAASQTKLPQGDHPVKLPDSNVEDKAAAAGGTKSKEKIYHELRGALAAFMKKEAGQQQGVMVEEQGEDGEDVIVDFLEDGHGIAFDNADRLVETLRAAGFDVRAETITVNTDRKKSRSGTKSAGGTKPKKAGNDDQTHHQDAHQQPDHHDEL